EYFVAPAHRLFPLLDKIGDDEASLLEPFSVCLRAVLNHPPQKKELVVVSGAGTIGLMNVAALKAVEPSCRVACVAKYPFQAALPAGVDWTPSWLEELTVVGSLTYWAEVFKGKRADTFARAIDFLARRRADLTPIRPRKYPLDRYHQALIEAASKKTSGAVKVSFVF